MRWLGFVATILWWSGIARSLSTLNRGHSYKISPKPCRAPGPDGEEGTCMFVWECIKSEGNHVGVCVDTFMFGSCCIHNSTTNNVNVEPSAFLPPNTVRPSLAEALSDEPTRLAPSSPRPRPQAHAEFSPPPGSGNSVITSSTPRTIASQRPRPTMGGLGPGRPGQKRPQGKPNTDNFDEPYPASGNQLDAPNHGGKTHAGDIEFDQAGLQVLDEQNNVQNSPGSRDPLGPSGQQHVQSHSDATTVSPTRNTLLVKLPTRRPSHQSQTVRPHRPGYNPKPLVPQKPSESRPDDSKPEVDLVVQATMHRPSIDTAGQKESESSNQHQNFNFIHTEPPKWATKPIVSHKPTDYSKPYFSIRTTTHRPDSMVPRPSTHQNQKPSSVSKPEAESPSSMPKPSYYSTQTTGTAGSTQQTVQWQVTTEPAFVTKHKTSSARPITILESTKPGSSNSHIWSENSWTPPKPSLKPHWTDNPAWMDISSGSFHSKPTRPTKPTRPHRPHVSTDFERPLGSAHYITTSYIETSTKSRPKKTSTSTTTTTTTTSTTTTTTSTSTTTTEKPSTQKSSTTPLPTTPSSTSSATPSMASVPTTSKTTSSVITVAANSVQKNAQCGVPPLYPRPETRIVGGKDAPFGRWPWQVSVRRTSFFGFASTHRCGGAVLNENWIATAGHCVDDLLTSQIRIRVGEYDFSSVQERYPFVERAVARKVVHPMYNFFTYEYDLALVRLETSLIFAPHISPICLPATDDLLVGENATVTGWGRLSEGGTLPSVLQEVSVPIVSNDKCKSMFLSAGRHEVIPEIFLCAGHEAGGQDSCQGDSGGPLQVRGKDGRYFLAGIISWGIGCAAANLPGVCTRISKFVPWILKNVT